MGNKEDTYKSLIIEFKEDLYQSKSDIFNFIENTNEIFSFDPSVVFEENNNQELEEHINQIFLEEENKNNLEDEKEDEYNYDLLNTNQDELNNENCIIAENDHNKYQNLGKENESLSDRKNISFGGENMKLNSKEKNKSELLKDNQINTKIDNNILTYIKNKNSKNINFTKVKENINHDPANIFYRMLCLAQREKIQIIQKEINDAENTFIKIY